MTKKKAVRIRPLLCWLLSCRGDETLCPRELINTGAQFITTVIFQTRTLWSAMKLPYNLSKNKPRHSIRLASAQSQSIPVTLSGCWDAARPGILQGRNTQQDVPILCFPCLGPTCYKTPYSLISSEFSTTNSWEPTVSHIVCGNLWGLVWEWPRLCEIIF